MVFALSATSIWSLLVDFYGLCPMRAFTLCVLLPCTALLGGMAVADRVAGDGRLWRAVVTGAAGGLLAAVAYDLFRLPFVVAAADQIGPAWLRLPLFKVFPRFGAMILGRPYTQAQTDSQFPLLTHVVGWAYHLGNGASFGVMYLAVLGDAGRRSWGWAAVMAAGLELALLFTPYTSFFGIAPTWRFVVVTLLAHLVFGVVLGLYARAQAIPRPG